jgi:L-lactate dehydrogenase complex protein LldG
MSSRDTIFENIRHATAGIKTKTPHPEYDDSLLHAEPRLGGRDLAKLFERNFAAVNGRTMQSLDQLADFFKQHDIQHGFCDGALFESVGRPLFDRGFGIATMFERERYDHYQFGITRATAAIAESGSLVIDDDRTSDRLAALAPWIHVAVLERSSIVRTIPEAIAAFDQSPNIIWVTGPSKTADVEGILIEGVHGPGEQIALLV